MDSNTHPVAHGAGAAQPLPKAPTGIDGFDDDHPRRPAEGAVRPWSAAVPAAARRSSP